VGDSYKEGLSIGALSDGVVGLAMVGTCVATPLEIAPRIGELLVSFTIGGMDVVEGARLPISS